MSLVHPLVSVLLPAHNAEKYINETIDSILAQTYTNFELLIADDCSTDDTRKIIDSYSDNRIKCFHNSENLRKPKTIQKLFENSKGELITMHDADDISLPQRFEKMVEVFQKQPDVYMCGHIIERMTEKGVPLGLYRKKSDDFQEIVQLMKTDNSDGDPSMFIKREVIEDLGEIFRPYFANNMDYDFALRVVEKYKTTNLLEVLSYYRNVPNSISKGVLTYQKLVTQDITKFLAQERAEGKKDALQRNDMATIKKMEELYSLPYQKDITLHFRKMANFFMYCKMNNSAIQSMLNAVRLEPFKFENWRVLQYCIRKTYLGF